MSTAARQAAASAGGTALENRNGRPRWRNHSTISGRPATYPPTDAKGLGQRADLDVHPAVQPEVIDDAAPAAPQHALAVRVVHHQQQVVALGHLDDAGQRRDVAVHREYAVGDDHAAAVRAGGLPDLLVQRRRVVVGVTDDARAGQAAAVDDAGVVQLVRENGVLFAHQRRHHGQVGGEAGLERDGGRGAFELGQPPLKLVLAADVVPGAASSGITSKFWLLGEARGIAASGAYALARLGQLQDACLMLELDRARARARAQYQVKVLNIPGTNMRTPTRGRGGRP